MLGLVSSATGSILLAGEASLSATEAMNSSTDSKKRYSVSNL
jgi:hypothetical protein